MILKTLVDNGQEKSDRYVELLDKRSRMVDMLNRIPAGCGQEMKEYDVDALVLGCTHYPLIRNAICRFLGDRVHLVNPAFETAKSLKELLTEQGLLNTSRKKPEYEYYVSDGVEKFIAFADSVLPCHVTDTQVVDIESY